MSFGRRFGRRGSAPATSEAAPAPTPGPPPDLTEPMIAFPPVELVFYDARGERIAVPNRTFVRMVSRAAARLRTHTAEGERIGLVFRTGPALLAWWFAAMTTKRSPLILQYPTEKQATGYWEGSVLDTLRTCGIEQVVLDPAVTALGPGARLRAEGFSVNEVLPAALEADPEAPILAQIRDAVRRPGSADTLRVPAGAKFLQQSSGTTGFRKGIEYRLADVAKHVGDFNAVVDLTPNDRVVSWLPLYHDMGFIACFLMPLLTGSRLVLMDPMDWVARKTLLLDAIREEQGTVCYMPNFGFQVMSGVATDQLASSMRLWVSCSEPSRPAALARFAERFAVPQASLASCYAMAENIFAVSFRRGIASREIDGVDVVSCGAAIPGVDVQVRDGVVHVRSAYAIGAYIGTDSIQTADGFYATGDLGQLIDGELYITGRRADLLNQAGQKFFLSDIDRLVNETLPWAQGRVAATVDFDSASGAESCRIFIEHPRFFDRAVQLQAAAALRGALPIPQFDTVLTPPGFITKTSSGKVNRKETARRYRDLGARRTASRKAGLTVLSGLLPGSDVDVAVDDACDSLGLLIVEMALGGRALTTADRRMSLRQLAAKHLDGEAPDTSPAGDAREYRIVSIADPAIRILRLGTRHLAWLERQLGHPVHIDYICMPPARVIRQYLTFVDWFPPDVDPEALEPLTRMLDLMRSASMILADDYTEIAHASCSYPLMDFDHERRPIADLLVYRHQHVAQQNHRLPIADVVFGDEMPPEERGQDLVELSNYLRVPIMRVAIDERYKPFTGNWEHHTSYPPGHRGITRPEIHRKRKAFLLALRHHMADRALLREARHGENSVRANEVPHYCCFIADPALRDAVIDRYDRLLFWGPEVNFEQFRSVAEARGKHVERVAACDSRGRLPVNEDRFDCIVQAGPWQRVRTRLPVVRLMHGDPPDVHNWTELGAIGPASSLLKDPADPTTGYDHHRIYAVDQHRVGDFRRAWGANSRISDEILGRSPAKKLDA